MRDTRVLLVPALLIGLAIAVLVLETLADDGRDGGRPPDGQPQTVVDFIAGGGDVCTLPLRPGGDLFLPPSPLPARINHATLIVVGHPDSSLVEEPFPGTVARVLTAFEVDDVLKGGPPGPRILMESGLRLSGGRDMRLDSTTMFDVCDSSPALLFLGELHTNLWFVLGWVSLSDGAIAGVSRVDEDVFLYYDDAEDLLAGVRETVAQHEADGVTRGRLICLEYLESRDGVIIPYACPGDSFNPYETLGLATAAAVVVSPRRLEAGSPQFDAIVNALDLEVAVVPGGPDPGDYIRISLVLHEATTGGAHVPLDYSETAGTVRMGLFGGQFVAPPALQEAMTPFLAP